MKQLQLSNLKNNTQLRDGLMGLLGVIVLIVGGVFLFTLSRGDGIPNKINRGGDYEQLAQDHVRGEEFAGYVNNAYDLLENENAADDAGAYLDLGFYKNELKDYEGSEDAYLLGLEKFPTHEVMLSNLAHLYENQKDYKNAEKYYVRLVDGNSRNIRAMIDLANMYRFYFDDKDDEIVQLLEVEGLANNPNEPNILILLANYYRYDIEDLRQAEIYYRLILELDPTNRAVEVELLNLMRSQGRSL